MGGHKDLKNHEDLITELIKKYNEYGFIGFVHCTEMENFVKIYKAGKMVSRNESKMIFDSADDEQIKKQEQKFPALMGYVRFYLAPKTPNLF